MNKKKDNNASREDCASSGRSELKDTMEKQRMTQEIILEKVLNKENLNEAFKRVKKNNGSAGMDGMECSQLLDYLKENGQSIQEEIRNKRYEPSPVRRVEIPKPDGGVRKLGVPTVVDRFVQQAVSQVLETVFEPEFHPNSFGFRPGKSAQQAITKAVGYINEGYNWIVDLDLEKFFDNVEHEKLISLLNKKVHDGNILALIFKFLKSGVINQGEYEESFLGMPQGGNLSPLCSNVVLNELDWELERRNLKFVRYADDCIIMVKSEKAATRVMQSITRYLKDKLKLKVNSSKSKIARPHEIKFLGYSFYCQFKQKKYRPRVHPKSAEKLIKKVKKLTTRSWGVDNKYKIKKINELIRGWTNYFKLGAMLTLSKKIDTVVRYRLRMCIWKHWKNPKTRIKRLIQLGVSEKNARKAASSLGYARVCKSETLCYAISNAKLEKFGLLSMEKYYLTVAC